MHKMSPGVERAVAGARERAARCGLPDVQLLHFILALFEEEEGRPAVLVERAGLSVTQIREQLGSLGESPVVPDNSILFNAAQRWSIANRHDPEFLTDAFLLAVLRADRDFERSVSALGLDPNHLEQLLVGGDRTAAATDFDTSHPLAVFTAPDPTGEVDAARVLDANFNRAREAARVLEDYCRFVLDDSFLTGQVKQLRHAIAAATAEIPSGLLLGSRETLRDVGVSITASGEYNRSSLAEVAGANLKRLQESLRTLEEFSKLFGADLGRKLEAVRYQAYTLERAIVSGGRGREGLGGARLYVLLTGGQCAGSLDWTIAQIAAGGADIVQLREKNLPDRELIERARKVRVWTRQVKLLFIVNDRPDIARLVEADGVHLGQDDLSVKDARRILGPNALIGVSTHSIDQVRQAILDGADYIGLGPVFPSRTKVFDHFPGLEFVRAALAETSLPAFALGGIGLENLSEVVAAGARRVAVGAAVTTVADPELATRQIRAQLG
ncbi:MAG TPA: thiamine phosphate synthase [Gemmata sp.]|nr:thiamine phosphate synthase [Gemmata sp.]